MNKSCEICGINISEDGRRKFCKECYKKHRLEYRTLKNRERSYIKTKQAKLTKERLESVKNNASGLEAAAKRACELGVTYGVYMSKGEKGINEKITYYNDRQKAD